MKRRRVAVLPLLQFIPSLSPRFREPTHLRRFAALLETADTLSTRAVCSVPPRHFKTETVKHAIVRMLLRDPSLPIIYATYAQTASEKKSREIRELARRAGVPISDEATSRKDWRTGVGDGGLWATSIGGPITGEGCRVLLIDDPVKDRATAESAVERAKLWDWIREVALTRLEPEGSAFLIQTRWHQDDPAGQLERRGWISVSLPAIDEFGRALDPKRFPIEKLREIEAEIGVYGWESLYQQRPRPRGGAVFVDAHYGDLPDVELQIRIGLDAAYSSKTSADYSAAIVMGEHEGVYYVLDVLRGQWRAPELVRRLRGLRDQYGAGPPRWYTGGQELGIAALMRSLGLDVETRQARGDKFQRAQPVAAAWNAGKVLLPRSAPWLDAFVSEIVSFTGTGGDVHDDQVDALAAAYDAVAKLGRRQNKNTGYAGSFTRLPSPYDGLGAWGGHRED